MTTVEPTVGALSRPPLPPEALDRYRPALRWLTRRRWPVLLVAAATSGVYRHIVLPDQIRFARGGGQILTGRLAEVYAQPWQQGGPFELLGSWLVLPFGFEHQAQYVHVSDGLTMLPAHLVGAVALFAALMATVARLRRGAGLPPAVELQVLAGALGLATLLPRSMWFGGHVSQLAIPFCWAWAAMLAHRGRSGAAAVVLGLSAGWETWGVLAVPLLLLDLRPRALARNGLLFTVAAVLPYLPFLLAGPFRMFDLVWPVSPWSLFHALLPAVVDFTWPMRVVQTALVLAAGSAVTLLLRGRRDVIWLAPVSVTLVRQLVDPLQLPYYWLPFFVLVLIGAGLLSSDAGTLRLITVLSLAAMPALIVVPVHPFGMTSGWTFLPCLALVAAAVTAARRGAADR